MGAEPSLALQDDISGAEPQPDAPSRAPGQGVQGVEVWCGSLGSPGQRTKQRLLVPESQAQEPAPAAGGGAAGAVQGGRGSGLGQVHRSVEPERAAGEVPGAGRGRGRGKGAGARGGRVTTPSRHDATTPGASPRAVRKVHQPG